jgi:fatty-acyl-CoA synthase
MHTINPGNPIEPTPSAYAYPLLIKQLLHTPLAVNAGPGDHLHGRSQAPQLPRAAASASAGWPACSARAGRGGRATRWAMMDWDSHRYLESYFAVPMMGADAA